MVTNWRIVIGAVHLCRVVDTARPSSKGLTHSFKIESISFFNFGSLMSSYWMELNPRAHLQ